MTKKPTKKKLRVGVLFGGRSGEHEVSLLSAASILNAIDRTKYEVVPIGITKQGQWITSNEATHLLAGDTKPAPVLLKTPKTKSLQLTASADIAVQNEALAQQSGPLAQSLDVIFPVLHGTFGEDGTIQGLFELADIAYVGSGVLGSATGMDKSAMKQLFAAAGLPQTPHVNLLRSEWKSDPKRCTKLIEKNSHLSRLRKTRESRLFRRHQQGPRSQRTRPRHGPRRQLRPQAHHRTRRRGPRSQASRTRSSRPRQRLTRSLRSWRNRPRRRVLRLQRQVPLRHQRPNHPRQALQIRVQTDPRKWPSPPSAPATAPV